MFLYVEADGCTGINTGYSTYSVIYLFLKISEVYIIHKSYGRDSGSYGTALLLALVQKSITTALVPGTEDYNYC